MLGIPSIENLRSNFSSFAARGAEPSFNFAQRYGGYQGTPAIAKQFRNEPAEMIKKTVPTDTKAVGETISSAFMKKTLEPETKFVSPSYERTQEPEESFSTIPKEFFANLTASQTYAQKTEADTGMMNAAAALKTTTDNTYGNLDLGSLYNFGGIPGGINFANLSDLYKNATTIPTKTPVVENPVIETPTAPPQPIKPVVYTPPEPPAKPTPTYTKSQQQNQEDDYEEIDSVDVVGRPTGSMGDTSDDFEDIESVDVTGRSRDYLKEARDSEDAGTQQTYQYDNPWERFKQLYADFYAGGEGGAVLEEYNRREAQGEFDPQYKAGMQKYMDLMSSSPTSRDTGEILRAKAERDQLMSSEYTAGAAGSQTNTGTTVINNNQTIATSKTLDSSRTSRVFSDDSTFNRAASSDIQHPRYG